MGDWWREDDPKNTVSGYLEAIPVEDDYDWRLHIDGDLGEVAIGYDTGIALHGNTSRGSMTLHHALPAGSRSSGQKMTSRWEGFILTRGPHFSRRELFSHVSFRVPFAIDWIGPSSLNRYVPPLKLPREAGHPGWISGRTAKLSEGVSLTSAIARTSSLSSRGHREEREWYGTYTLESSGGITLDDAMEVAYDVAKLHSLAFDTPMSSFALSLKPLGDSLWEGLVEVVDPHPPDGHDWSGLSPFFDSSEVDFELFIRNWIEMRRRLSLLDVALPLRSDREGTVQVQFLAQCAVLEAFAERYWDRPGLEPSDETILSALESQGIAAKARNTVRTLLERRRWPLKVKLVRAAQLMGLESSQRLLGNVDDWAYLVMRLRNALTHGGALPRGLDTNHEYVIDALTSLQAVLRLALLKQAGYSNKLGGTEGELYWSGTAPVASHINSSFFKKLEWISSRSPQWGLWRAQIDDAGNQ